MKNKKDNDILNRIEEVLNKIRPFLQREGGNIKVERYDEKTGICYVNMLGACQGCSLAAFDVSESIEVLLTDEIPEITKVELVDTDANRQSLLQELVNTQNKNKKEK